MAVENPVDFLKTLLYSKNNAILLRNAVVCKNYDIAKKFVEKALLLSGKI